MGESLMGLLQFCFSNIKRADLSGEYQSYQLLLLTVQNQYILFSRGTLSCLWQGIDLPKCRCLHVALGETLWPLCVPVYPQTPTPFALFAFTPRLSLPPPGLSSQRSTSAEANVWLDAINKTIIWDGLPSRPAQLVRPSAMNHLDRGRPSRRQTLNISPVGFLQSIPVHVSAFFHFFLLCTLGL